MSLLWVMTIGYSLRTRISLTHTHSKEIVCRFSYMGDKILKVSKWLRNRTLIEKIIIHILMFPLPIIVLLLAYGIFGGEKNKRNN